MKNAEPEENLQAWNVVFLVRDFPADLRTVGPSHFTSCINEDFLSGFKKLERQEASILNFIAHYSASRFVWIGFRVEGARKLDALAEAHHRMEGLIDGGSLWFDNDLPEISGFAWVGLADDADLKLVGFRRQIWLKMVSAPSESVLAWEEKNRELKIRVNRFLSLAIEHHSKSTSELAIQIRHSMRMFRHGKQSGSWGVEFICKFCALEGLVCGSERLDKNEKLKQRLSLLFADRSAEFTDQIGKLWGFRNGAVHTAKAFDAGSLSEGAPLGVHIEQIEYLFVGVLVFALERLTATETVADLWATANTYQLPAFARVKRPRNYRYAAPNMEVGMGITMPGGGELFRTNLAKGLASYQLANPTKP